VVPRPAPHDRAFFSAVAALEIPAPVRPQACVYPPDWVAEKPPCPNYVSTSNQRAFPCPAGATQQAIRMEEQSPL